MPIRVCHLITDLDVGGAEMALFRLLQGLDRREYPASVVSLTVPGRIGEMLVRGGTPVEALGMPRGRPTLSGWRRWRRWLRRERPDIVHSWMYHADLLGTISYLAGGSPRLLWNVRASMMDMGKYPWTSAAVRRACVWLSRVPDAVVFNSVAGERHHQRLGYRPRRSLVIPNGLDTEVFRPDQAARRRWRERLALRDTDVAVGMLARTDEMKDHPTFLAAAEQVARLRDNVHFVLAGHGVSGDHEPFARSGAVLGRRLHLLGLQDDAPGLTAALDVATLVSRGEGFPNVVVEAMACGVPCVVSDVGDAATIVGEAGFVVPLGDAAALAAAWLEVLDRDASEKAEIGGRGRARAIERFTLDRMAQAYSGLYRAVVEQPDRAARPPA